MMYLTRRKQFNAAHRVFNPDWSDEKNMEVFGKCANKNGHGHNYILYVTVKGEPNPQTGFIMNAKELSDIIDKFVFEKVDHLNLNIDVDFMKGIQPTAENLAKAIWNQLKPNIKNCQLYSVKLHETENIFVEYLGE